MSSNSLKHTLARIKGSTPESPIAVFMSPVRGELNSVFAATIQTQMQIRNGDPQYIGTFHGGQNSKVVEQTLRPYC